MQTLKPGKIDRQAYPEWFGADYCYTSDIDNLEREARAMAQALNIRVHQFAGECMPAAPDISHLNWAAMAAGYEQLLQSVSAHHKI